MTSPVSIKYEVIIGAFIGDLLPSFLTDSMLELNNEGYVPQISSSFVNLIITSFVCYFYLNLDTLIPTYTRNGDPEVLHLPFHISYYFISSLPR